MLLCISVCQASHKERAGIGLEACSFRDILSHGLAAVRRVWGVVSPAAELVLGHIIDGALLYHEAVMAPAGAT